MKKHFVHFLIKRVLPVFAAGVILAAVVRAVVYFYGKLSCNWHALCEPPGRLFYSFEFPILILFGALFYVPDKRPARNILTALAASLPAIACYAVFDAFYLFRHRPLSFSDFPGWFNVWHFSPLLFAGLLMILAASVIPPILLGIRNIRWYGFPSNRLILKAITVFILILLILNSFVLAPFQSRVLWFVDFSDFLNVNANGRFTSMIYYKNKSDSTTRTLALRRMKDIPHPLAAVPTGWKRRNVHIIILESFMDPRHIKDITFSRPPLYEKLSGLLGGSWFNTAVSPIYGGGTAQAEFEILCGVPAFGKTGPTEFNVFDGGKVKNLVAALKERGYASVASIASESYLYNCVLAYRSMGFDEVYFVDDGGVYSKRDKGHYIFDGDLLEQNLAFIQSRYISRGKPVVNYVLGMFGHLPFERDRERFPDILTATVSGEPSKEVNDLSNQFYYRTRAIHEFLSKLRRIDPDGIVLIVADHLPAVLNKDIRYVMQDTENVFVLFNGPIRYRKTGHIHYFDFPYLVMSLLTGTKVDVPDSQALEDLYFDILAAGSKME